MFAELKSAMIWSSGNNGRIVDLLNVEPSRVVVVFQEND